MNCKIFKQEECIPVKGSSKPIEIVSQLNDDCYIGDIDIGTNMDSFIKECDQCILLYRMDGHDVMMAYASDQVNIDGSLREGIILIGHWNNGQWKIKYDEY